MNVKIRSLNAAERETIENALLAYLKSMKAGDKQAWSAKVILDDMLDGLLWIDRTASRSGL